MLDWFLMILALVVVSAFHALVLSMMWKSVKSKSKVQQYYWKFVLVMIILMISVLSMMNLYELIF